MQSLNTCKAVIQDAFKVFKAHYEDPDMDRLPEDFNQVYLKYGNKFCYDIIIAMTEELERREAAHGTI